MIKYFFLILTVISCSSGEKENKETPKPIVKKEENQKIEKVTPPESKKETSVPVPTVVKKVQPDKKSGSIDSLQTSDATDIPKNADGTVKLDVGYGPTPPYIVKEIVKMGKITSTDKVYDLGCGDGRIVIACAKIGAKGVGIDMDPAWIKKSREIAAKEKVDHLVKFYNRDIFKTDFSDATVVVMYLWPSVNLRLRPILFKTLKPGTRVMSHNHSMKDWDPDEFYKDKKHRIYYWIMPADMSGKWSFNLKSNEARLEIKQKFQFINGWLHLQGKKLYIKRTKIIGKNVKFKAQGIFNKKFTEFVFNADVEKKEIRGTVEITVKKNKESVKFLANRDVSK
ncbi:class I SAM-dependent methyltransferase [Myxococcota bacterium]|nr:class I SAM-dependent methyltransferase [Myxococcota bacterium]MBU1380012.1 class I SAM-dependent methyltransferase [Myxococcota bacterium]MBU1496043.1 class I SAM-dependent methyltransferase [Myxococcota bacterium]